MNDTSGGSARRMWRLWPAAIVAAVIVVAAIIGVVNGRRLASGSQQNNLSTIQTDGVTQTSEASQVTIAVTWQGSRSAPAFRVALDTHSVDLSGYDLSRLAVLRTDQGIEVQASGWNAPISSHHREGTLTFPATDSDGQPLIGPSTRSIELIIRNVAGVPERTFRWTR